MSQFSKYPLALGTMLKSGSGRTYRVEEFLAERRKALLCVYCARYVDPGPFEASCKLRASAERRNFIAKNMIRGESDYQLSLQKPL
jgi:hypothetical protein